MATLNYNLKVCQGLTLLQAELSPLLEKILAIYPDLNWSLSKECPPDKIDAQIELCLEVKSLLDVILNTKGNAFKKTSSRDTQKLVATVCTICSKIIYGHEFSFEDADRAFGEMLDLLQKYPLNKNG
jgi:hypothetical protein